MNLYQLRYFKTMAEVQHYRKASQILCVTQPTLSNAISALEDDLGAPLFERQGRNVVLSKIGRVFLGYVDNVLDELNAGINKVKELSNDVLVPLNVGFIYTLSSYFIPHLIASITSHEKYSYMRFCLHEGNTENECTPGLIKKLKRDELDFVFASRLPKDSDIEFVPICAQNLVVILPLESEHADKKSIDLTELEDMPYISYSGKTGLRKEIHSLFDMAEIVPKTYCEVDGDITMIGMVAANIGFSIVPETPILKRFKVKVVPISTPEYQRIIYLGYMKNRYETLPVQHFKDYVCEHGNDIMFSVLEGGERIQEPAL